MTTIFFRPAVEADTSIVNRHSAAALKEADSYRGSLPVGEAEGPESAFVAGLAGEVLGSIVVVRNADGTAQVRRVYVEPDAREVGIGDTLLTGALDELRRRGCHWVSGSALPGDRQTKNLFERHGLVAQTIIVGRVLSDSSTGEDASR